MTALDEYNGSINWPEWSGLLDLTYTVSDWKFRYGVEWIDSMESYTLLGEPKEASIHDYEVGSYLEHFASVRFNNGSWEVTGGVRNLLNEEPPTISQGFYNRVGNAPLYSGYDYVGRRVFLQLAKKF